jgi:hypothetical protein
MESNELLKPTEDEHIFSSLSSAAITLEAQPTNELKAPDVADILQGIYNWSKCIASIVATTHTFHY